MAKLCFNSRDELVIIDIDKIAYIKADGNYTKIIYISGQETNISLGLSKLEEFIRRALPKDKPSSFVRLGRSLMINQKYLYHISITRQRVTLSEYQDKFLTINGVPKALIKNYKELLGKTYAVNNDK